MVKRKEKRQIVVVAMPHTMLLDVAGPCDVFSRADVMASEKFGNSEGYKITVVSPDSSHIVTSASGVSFYCNDKIEKIQGSIDTLLIAGFPSLNEWILKPAFINWLKDKSRKARRIGSVCKGAFILAEAGLLKNKKATTHWKFCDELQKKFPEIKVDSDPIFIKDGKVYTSAGVSSGIDLALALVEEDYGRDIALQVARHLVLYLRRPGNQSQFSVVLSQQESDYEPIRNLQNWMLDHLKEPLGIEQLAEKCSMSPRNFARVFHKEMGLTPGKYLEKLRVETARRLLEETHLSLEQVATDCGLGSADTMRRLFIRHLKTTPSDYRRIFRTSLEPELTD